MATDAGNEQGSARLDEETIIPEEYPSIPEFSHGRLLEVSEMPIQDGKEVMHGA